MAKASPQKAESSNTVAALERGIAVLRELASAPRMLTHGELAERTGISKPSVTRLVGTLVSHGLVRHALETDRYGLSAGVVSLAQSFLAGLDVRAAARPHMAELAEATGGWVYLAVRDGNEMVIVETCRARTNMFFSRLDVGSRLPFATSSLGRAYLSGLDAPSRAALLAPNTRGFAQVLREAQSTGLSISAGHWHPEINTIACAFRTATDELIAINCGGPAAAFPEDRLRRVVGPRLRSTAIAIANEIGGTVPLLPRRARAIAA